MTNPFEDQNASYLVLCNEEGQYSLWPEFVEIPEGWFQKFGPEPRSSCLTYIEQNWTDMRPRSLVVEMELHAASSVEPATKAIGN